MKRRGILAAVALVLATDGFVLVEVAHNRSGSPGAAIELTERELRMTRPQRDSTALLLELAWRPRREVFKFEDGPGWFDKSKLEELGYDCRLPLTDPSARARYRGMPAKEAFAVLEYKDAAGAGEGPGSSTRSRLRAVDAGKELAALRKKYADSQRHLIVPALVRLFYAEKWDDSTRRYAPGAYLRGAIVDLLVSEIAVPPSERHVLESMGQTTDDYFATEESKSRGPRYSAVLHYGRNNEPWIDSCRPIPAARR
jgi:hypothetical protein